MQETKHAALWINEGVYHIAIELQIYTRANFKKMYRP